MARKGRGRQNQIRGSPTMDLLRLKLGAISAACAAMLGMGAIESGPPPGGLPAAPELSGECPWDCGDFDGEVGIVDFLFLLSQWDDIGTSCDFDGGGVGIVDFLKLLANWGLCPGVDVCDAASGDCCVANPTPGCDDPTCCDAVCSLDPFCCDANWDGLCADHASLVCPECKACDPACGVACAGDCCVANGSPFCDDAFCCDFVCRVLDPFCCDVEWDATCADLAAQVCTCP